MLPGNFLGDRNLVSFGDVLLRFRHENAKHNDVVMYLLGGFESMLIRGECW